MTELFIATYLAGFAATLLYLLIEGPRGDWPTDAALAIGAVIWPPLAVAAIGYTLYRHSAPLRQRSD